MTVPNERLLDQFTEWSKKQDQKAFDAVELLKMLTTEERLVTFLDFYQEEVIKATLSWAGEHLEGLLGEALEEEPDLEVFTGEVVERFKEEMNEESEG